MDVEPNIFPVVESGRSPELSSVGKAQDKQGDISKKMAGIHQTINTISNNANSLEEKKLLVQHPACVGPMPLKEAENILSFLPIGSWIIRYSVRENQVVISKKTGINSYEVLKEICTEGKTSNIADMSLKDILGNKEFERDKLVLPKGVTLMTMPFPSTTSDLTSATPSPTLPVFRAGKPAELDKADELKPIASFTPVLKFTLNNVSDFNQFKKDWENEKMDKVCKINFDKNTNSFSLPYTDRELTPLVNKYPFLKKYFGEASKNIFKGYFSTVQVMVSKTGLIQDTSTLKQEANTFFKNLIPKNLELNIPPVASPNQLIEEILIKQNFPGLFIGERHELYQAKEFLINNMMALKDAGVKTLFMEHLCYDIIQQDLDDYKSSKSTEMPVILEAYLDSMDVGCGGGIGFQLRERDFGYKAVVKAAIQAGIRVVGIDTDASYRAGYHSGWGSQGVVRIECMNYQANKIISQEFCDQKFVALVGNTHVSTTHKTPGLSEIMGYPNIVILDSKDESLSIEYGVKDLLPQADERENKNPPMGGYIHFLVKMPHHPKR